MSVANAGAVKYAELTDEHIADVKKGIELFVQSDEYWDKFAHHSVVPKGHKTFTSRRLIAPKVKAEDISPRAEFIAPRPSKIAVATFSKTVQNYGDKAIYSREDIQYHFDDTVNAIRLTLQEIAVQKLDLIKGAAFVSSRAVITYDTSIINTLDKAAMIFRKNKVKRWDGSHYLAHVTPEMMSTIRSEIEAKHEVITERRKGEIEGVDTAIGTWRDWVFSLTTSPVVYKSNGTKQILVLQGRRGIDGEPGVDVAKLEGESGIELINNGLGSGILVDEDGNYTTDDNKQQGAIAINMDGLGAAVSDDLAILNCELTLAEVKGTALANPAGLHGYVSESGNEHVVTLSGTTYTEFALVGARYDSNASAYYAPGNTLIAVQVKAASAKTLGSVTAANWTATYKLTSAGDNINAEIIGVVKTAANNDTLIVRVPDKCYSFTVACAATAS